MPGLKVHSPETGEQEKEERGFRERETLEAEVSKMRLTEQGIEDLIEFLEAGGEEGIMSKVRERAEIKFRQAKVFCEEGEDPLHDVEGLIALSIKVEIEGKKPEEPIQLFAETAKKLGILQGFFQKESSRGLGLAKILEKLQSNHLDEKALLGEARIILGKLKEVREGNGREMKAAAA